MPYRCLLHMNFISLPFVTLSYRITTSLTHRLISFPDIKKTPSKGTRSRVSTQFHQPLSAGLCRHVVCPCAVTGVSRYGLLQFRLIGSEMHFPFLSVSASTVRTRFSVFEKVLSFFLACVDEFLKICPPAGFPAGNMGMQASVLLHIRAAQGPWEALINSQSQIS